MGAATIRVIAPIPGHRGRVRIIPGTGYSVNGPKCGTIPRISIGQRTLDAWRLVPGYHPARVFRSGIVVALDTTPPTP